MKKILSLCIVAASVTCAMSASADELTFEQKGQAAVTAAAERMSALSPQLEVGNFKYDAKLHEVFHKKTGANFVPLSISGKQYFTDSKGTGIVEPSALIIDGNGAISRANEVLVEYRFDSMETEWVTKNLDEGVEKKADLYVFTDPTCGYCRKVDEEVEIYRSNGIQMHYIPFPRGGINPGNPGFLSWAKAACAENPADAYHDIIMGKPEASSYKAPSSYDAECVRVVSEGYEFGAEIGVTGTPFIYGLSTNGVKMQRSGYDQAKNIAAALGIIVRNSGTF